MNKFEQISAEKSNPVSKKNENLHGAKKAKNDEFYTQLSDCSAQINLAGSNQHFIQLIHRKGGSRRNRMGFPVQKKDDNRTNSCD